jgi:hypothetical protein
MTSTIFIINKGMAWIACMKEFQVSGTLSGEWFGHIAWRDSTSSEV